MVTQDPNVLLGKNLANFDILKMYEVQQVNEEGAFVKSAGFFKNETIAKAYAGKDSNYLKVKPSIILTDGTEEFSFILNHERRVIFFNDEEEALKIKQEVLATLTPEQKTILGL